MRNENVSEERSSLIGDQRVYENRKNRNEKSLNNQPKKKKKSSVTSPFISDTRTSSSSYLNLKDFSTGFPRSRFASYNSFMNRQRKLFMSICFIFTIAAFTIYVLIEFQDRVDLNSFISELEIQLSPSSATYCIHSSLWVPFYPNKEILLDQDLSPPNNLEGMVEEENASANAKRNPSIVIISAIGPSETDMKQIVNQNIRVHKEYADLWGYDHVIWIQEENSADEHVSTRANQGLEVLVTQQKFSAIKKCLDQYDYIVFLDVSVVIREPNLRLSGFLSFLEKSSTADILLSEENNGLKNPDVMIVKKSTWSKWFFSELLRISPILKTEYSCSDENCAFHHAIQSKPWENLPTFEKLPLIESEESHPSTDKVRESTKQLTESDINTHFLIVPQCALNAIDIPYSGANFMLDFRNHNVKKRKNLMNQNLVYGKNYIEKVFTPLFQSYSVSKEIQNSLPVVYQTWKTNNLKEIEDQKKARYYSWLRNGFNVILKNNEDCLKDIEQLMEISEDRYPFREAYEKLSPVQRADFWRYVVIYLNGGIYSDIDIGASPETTFFFLALRKKIQANEIDLVGIIENDLYNNPIGKTYFHLGMSPMYARVPQLRQSFFYARKGHPRLFSLLVDITEMIMSFHDTHGEALYQNNILSPNHNLVPLYLRSKYQQPQSSHSKAKADFLVQQYGKQVATSCTNGNTYNWNRRFLYFPFTDDNTDTETPDAPKEIKENSNDNYISYDSIIQPILPKSSKKFEYTEEALKNIQISGLFTLELTGPGIWTDHLLPLCYQIQKLENLYNDYNDYALEEAAVPNSILQEQEGQKIDTKSSISQDWTESMIDDPNRNIILSSQEGYKIMKYSSMGSWKTDSHKADNQMITNIILFHGTVLIVVAFVIYLGAKFRYQEGKKKENIISRKRY